MSGKSRQHDRSYPVAVAITVSLCAFWGMAHGFYGVIARPFYRFFELSELAHNIAALSSGLTYIVVAIPAALFLRKLGYKLAIVFGLSAFSVGTFLLYPAVAQHQVLFFVAAMIATATGWAFLETSANPLICRMGSEKNALARLNFAQALYPFGFVVATLGSRGLFVPGPGNLGEVAIETMMRPYISTGLVLLLVAFLIENVAFPRVAETRNESRATLHADIRTMLSRREFRIALVAMCCSMAGLVLVNVLCYRFPRYAWPAAPANLISNAILVFWIIVAAGRFIGAALVRYIDPLRLLAFASAACAAFLLFAILGKGAMGVACLFGAALFLSISFPTIFGEALRHAGDLVKPASSLLVMAAGVGSIAGGNVMRWLSPSASVPTGLAVSAVCFAVIAAAAVSIRRSRQRAELPKPEPLLCADISV